jgi:hypothetical protein
LTQLPPAELFAQLRAMVSLMAAPAAEQERWADESGFPIEEVLTQLDLGWPLWQELWPERRSPCSTAGTAGRKGRRRTGVAITRRARRAR